MDKAKLISEILAKKKLALEACQNFNEAGFKTSINGKWAASGHIEHLINSIKPLNQLFILPKFVLTVWVGKPNRTSRSYESLVEKYTEKLKTNNPTINRFGPSKDKNRTKQELLKLLEKQYENFAKKLETNWTDETLENYLIPHPLLGKLTVKEMVMFTIYHTEHHIMAIK